MRNILGGKSLLLLVGSIMFLAGWLAGQEKASTQKTVIHAASWTALDTMTPQAFETFRAETAALVGKVPGMRRAWVGKLREPVTFDGMKRDYGVVFEFDDVKTKQDYSDHHPSPWYEHFNALRKPGSSNFDVVGNSSK